MFSLDILFLCFANDALGQLFELGLQKSEVQDSLLERNGYTQPKGLEVTVYNDLAHQVCHSSFPISFFTCNQTKQCSATSATSLSAHRRGYIT